VKKKMDPEGSNSLERYFPITMDAPFMHMGSMDSIQVMLVGSIDMSMVISLQPVHLPEELLLGKILHMLVELSTGWEVLGFHVEIHGNLQGLISLLP
jgi:hypothetical protein